MIAVIFSRPLPHMALAAMLLAGAAVPSAAPAHAGRIIDACSYITGWDPARARCYLRWKDLCKLIKDAQAAARCVTVLDAAEAGAAPPAAPVGDQQAAQADDNGNRGGEASASSLEAETGETTTSVRNPDGSRSVTVTDASGNVIETRVEPARAPASASATDRKTGITTTSVRNEDGSRTVTRTDSEGKLLSTEVVPAKGRAEASATDASGTTTRAVRNEDGSRTVTVTDSDGNVLSRETRPAPEENKAAAAPEAEPAPQAPQGARLIEDFCAHVPGAAGANCYRWGAVVKSLCPIIQDPKGQAECFRITGPVPGGSLGPFE